MGSTLLVHTCISLKITEIKKLKPHLQCQTFMKQFKTFIYIFPCAQTDVPVSTYFHPGHHMLPCVVVNSIFLGKGKEYI